MLSCTDRRRATRGAPASSASSAAATALDPGSREALTVCRRRDGDGLQLPSCLAADAAARPAARRWRARHRATDRAPTFKVRRLPRGGDARRRRADASRASTFGLRCVAAAPDGSVITGSSDGTVKVWRDGACERTIKARTRSRQRGGGAAWRSTLRQRLSSTAPRSCGRSTATSSAPSRSAARTASPRCQTRALCGRRPTSERPAVPRRRRSSTPSGHGAATCAVAVTPDGQHIIGGGSCDSGVKVWSVASKSLVSTCAGHTAATRWRRCPTASASSAAATRPSACGSSTAPSRTPF